LAAREELALLGIDPKRCSPSATARIDPAVDGHNEDAWSRNRRGEFVLLTPRCCPPISQRSAIASTGGYWAFTWPDLGERFSQERFDHESRFLALAMLGWGEIVLILVVVLSSCSAPRNCPNSRAVSVRASRNSRRPPARFRTTCNAPSRRNRPREPPRRVAEKPPATESAADPAPTSPRPDVPRAEPAFPTWQTEPLPPPGSRRRRGGGRPSQTIPRASRGSALDHHQGPQPR
jgi:hypothetical protein